MPNCTYCGLAREHPGLRRTIFIRVASPLPCDLVAENRGTGKKQRGRQSLCRQVQDHRANGDLIDMTSRVRSKALSTHFSTGHRHHFERRLAEADSGRRSETSSGLDRCRFRRIFTETRVRAPKALMTGKHWKIVLKAREMFGSMKVNCHLIVGLGETTGTWLKCFTCSNRADCSLPFLFQSRTGDGDGSAPRVRLPEPGGSSWSRI